MSLAEAFWEDSSGSDHRIVRAIDDCLVESLGRDMALAVRVCLDSSMALEHPLDYQVALAELVGGPRARAAIARLEKKLRAQVGNFPATKWMHFAVLVPCLRGRSGSNQIVVRR